MDNMLTGALWYFWLPSKVIDSHMLKRSSAGQFHAHAEQEQCTWPRYWATLWHWFGPCDLGQAAVLCSRQDLGTKIRSDDPHSSFSDQGDIPVSLLAQWFLMEYLLPTLPQPWFFYSKYAVNSGILHRPPFGRWFIRAPDVISTSSLLRSPGFHSCPAIYTREMNVLQKHLLPDPVYSESGCSLCSSCLIKSDFKE